MVDFYRGRENTEGDQGEEAMEEEEEGQDEAEYMGRPG